MKTNTVSLVLILTTIGIWIVSRVKLFFQPSNSSSKCRMTCHRKTRTFDTSATITFNFPGGHFYIHIDQKDITKNYFRCVFGHAIVEIKSVKINNHYDLELHDNFNHFTDCELYILYMVKLAKMTSSVQMVKNLLIKKKMTWSDVFVWFYLIHMKYFTDLYNPVIVDEFYNLATRKNK